MYHFKSYKMVDKHIQITTSPKFVKSCIFVHSSHVLKYEQDTCLHNTV